MKEGCKMRKNDFDFIKNKFDRCESDVPDGLDTKMIEYKILTGRNYRVIKFKKKKNYRTITSAAACFIIVFAVIFASVSGAVNSDKAFTFNDYNELNTRISSLEKNADSGGQGGPMKTHLYKEADGVENSDTVKTDEKYIYYIYNNIVYIFETANGSAKLVSKIDYSDDINAETESMYVYDLLIYNDRLIVNIDKKNILLSEKYQCDISTSVIMVYDITDRSAPSLIYEFEQSGSYRSSKLIENKLYVVTNYGVSDADGNNVLPYIKNGSETAYASSKNVSCFEAVKTAKYAVISVTDIDSDERSQTLMAVLGGDSDVKFTRDNIYINEYVDYTADEYNNSSANAQTIKLDLKKYKFSYADSEDTARISDDIEINRYEAFVGVVYPIGDKLLCIGSDLNTVTDEIILYDKNMNELDNFVLDSMQLLSQRLFLNEETNEIVIPIYSADDEKRSYGIAVFKIQNDKIVFVDKILHEELLIAGNCQFVMIDKYFYCFAEDIDYADNKKVNAIAFDY